MSPGAFPEAVHALAAQFDKLYFKPVPESVIEGQIVTIDHFFSDKFCNELIKSFQKLSLETTPLIKSKDYAARFNDRALVTDFAAADSLWRYLEKVIRQPLDYKDEDNESIKAEFRAAQSLNPQLRVYRYTKGHHFGKHYDESVVCPLAHDPTKNGRTRWTLLIYLTGGDDFQGGGTVFYPGREALNVHPAKGMALLHKHGNDCLAHEAELVTAGEKWVLRSDVLF